MISYSQLDPSKKAFVFELDNVLFPEKDYLLQVYYLFANFLEYLEGYPSANDLTQFMKKVYENHGEEQIFDKAKEVFGFDEKYRENFSRLHGEAKLPLKLLLFQNALSLLQDIVVDRKELFIVTGGNPIMQLNKIRQTDWNGLEKYLRVYFADELAPKPATDIIDMILEKYGFHAKDILIFGASALDQQFAQNAEIDFVKVKF